MIMKEERIIIIIMKEGISIIIIGIITTIIIIIKRIMDTSKKGIGFVWNVKILIFHGGLSVINVMKM